MKKMRFFTKEEIREVISLWESETLQTIAERLGRKTTSVLYLANKIRKCGYDLPKKRIVSRTDNLIKEVLTELE